MNLSKKREPAITGHYTVLIFSDFSKTLDLYKYLNYCSYEKKNSTHYGNSSVSFDVDM